jgi:hypothetical protein
MTASVVQELSYREPRQEAIHDPISPVRKGVVHRSVY